MPGKTTMTIQNDTPGGQKPPTLAELRKLAKAKGCDSVDISCLGSGHVAVALRWSKCGSFERTIASVRQQPERAIAVRALFAALSALPDKERAR